MNTALILAQRRSLRWKGALALCLAVCTLGLSVSASPGGKLDIKTFSAPGGGTNGATNQGSFGIGINFWGTIVGLIRDQNDARHGFLRAPDGTFTIINHLDAGTGPFQGTKPSALNAVGTVVGTYTDANDLDHGFIRAPDGTFTTVDHANTLGGNLLGINLEGAAVGNYVSASDSQYHAFVRSPRGVITDFDPPGSLETDIPNSPINDAGVITGDYLVCTADFSSCAINGFVRARNGAIKTFSVPGAGGDASSFQGTFPQAINDEGAITGLYIDGNTVVHGFVRARNGSLTTFDVPGACTAVPPPASCTYGGTWAYSINQWGAITGVFYGEDGVAHSFWRTADGSIHTFDARGAADTAAVSINFWGQITGQAFDSSGVVHGFVLKP
jgi:hypothetical protein